MAACVVAGEATAEGATVGEVGGVVAGTATAVVPASQSSITTRTEYRPARVYVWVTAAWVRAEKSEPVGQCPGMMVSLDPSAQCTLRSPARTGPPVTVSASGWPVSTISGRAWSRSPVGLGPATFGVVSGDGSAMAVGTGAGSPVGLVAAGTGAGAE
jgi:hypothetical protein